MQLFLCLFSFVFVLVTVKPFGLLRFENTIASTPLVKAKVLQEQVEKVIDFSRQEDIAPDSVIEDVTKMGIGFDGGGTSISGIGGSDANSGSAAVMKVARVLRRVDPSYPEKARSAQLSGSVILKIHISDSGEVLHCLVVSSEPAGVFDQSAIQAVQKWSFEPAVKDGQRVASYLLQKVSFRMENL